MCNFHCLFIDACKGYVIGIKGAYNFCDNFVGESSYAFPFEKLFFLLSHVLFTLKSNLLNIPQLTDDCHEKWHETQVYQLEIHLLDLSKVSGKCNQKFA